MDWIINLKVEECESVFPFFSPFPPPLFPRREFNDLTFHVFHTFSTLTDLPLPVAATHYSES